MPFKKIALFYGHVASNLGDLAINRGEAALLERAFPRAALHVVFFGSDNHKHASAARLSFGERLNLSFSHFVAGDKKALDYQTNPARLLDDCGAGDADLIVLASGEHIFRYAKEENTKNLFWRMLPVLAAKASNKACVVLPSTFGPFEDSISADAVVSLLSLADAVAVRESLSGKLLSAGFGRTTPPQLLDPAFFITPSPTAGSSRVHNPAAGNVLGLVMRSEGWGIRLSAEERRERSASFQEDGYRSSQAFQFSVALCEAHLAQRGARVRLFVQAMADEDLARRVRDSLASSENSDRIEFYRPNSVQDYVAQLAHVDQVVASRFHAIVLALTVNRPVFGVYFDVHGHKMPGLFDLLGLQQNCINLSVTEPEKAAEIISEALPDLCTRQSNTQKEIERLRRQTVSWLAGVSARPADSKSIVEAFGSFGSLSSLLIHRGYGSEMRKKNEDDVKIALLQQQLSEARKQIASLTAELSAARQTALFKLRMMLISWVRVIHAVLRHPRKHLRLAKEFWRERSVQRFQDVYRRGGVDAVVSTVAAAYRTEPGKQASQLVRIGKALLDAGHPEAEFPLAQKAVSLERSEPVLTAYFWAAQRNKRFEEASDAILELERLFGPAPTNAQARLLEKLKAAPAYRLTTLKLVGPRQPHAFRPVPRRLCYVLHNSFPYSSGGYAARSQGLAEGLVRSGYEVIAITRPGFPLDTVPDLRADDVPEEELVGGITYVRTFEPLRGGRSASKYIVSAADAISMRLREYRPEIVMAASNHLTGLPTLIAARRVGIPFVYEVRGLWEITRLSREPSFENHPAFETERILEAAVAKSADHVFTITDGLREEMAERGVPKDKMVLLPNSCDPERFVPVPRDVSLAQRLGIPDGIPVIGYAGTFTAYEGLEDLAEACGLLKEKGLEFRLLLVGNENTSGTERGPITENIARIAAERGFAKWLVMPGRVPHDDVKKYYSLIDICPFPRKPWPVCEIVSPLKPLEALAMEKAVVVSSVRALAEMIKDGETGLVFRKGNTNDLANALERLIKDEPLRNRLGKGGRQWVQQYRTWSSTAGIAAKHLSALSSLNTESSDERFGVNVI